MTKNSFDMAFFQGNRRRLLAELPSDALVIITGHGEMQRSHDMAYEFEQEASFWYLTGIGAPDWQAVIDAKTQRTILVAPMVDKVREVFDGSLSIEAAQALSGADEVIGLDQAEALIDSLKNTSRPVYSLFPDKFVKRHTHFALNPLPEKLIRRLKKTFRDVKDCRPHVQKLRTIKQSEEVAAIEEAIGITAQAFAAVADQLPILKHEYEVEAVMSYEMRRAGARGHAYTPIVASGGNACTLHYVQNNDQLKDDRLLLIDVGARGPNNYAADITRTLAVNPTARQIEVYEAVRAAQQRCIEAIVPGRSFDDYQQETDRIMKSSISALGLDASKYRDYFPHAIGHGLGLDVHDSLAGYTSLTPGMVLTVEPGIYIEEESIGVRIEDNILVTRDGYRNLSATISRQLQ